MNKDDRGHIVKNLFVKENAGCSTIESLMHIAFIIILAFSSYLFAQYLRIEPRELIWIILFFSSLFALKTLDVKSLKKVELCSFAAFCLLYDLALILGYHITITGSTYDGSYIENYISPYSLIDIAAFALIFPCLYVLVLRLYRLIAPRSENPRSVFLQIDRRPIPVKSILVLAIIPFICWLPYLLIYWPGLIFNDTLSSLAQATDLATYSNHHPFLYSMFIKLCLSAGNSLGIGNTGGCVIYCLAQMGFMAYVFSYVSRWIVVRCDLRLWWDLIIVLLFSLSPYVATSSIAMWKDPFFSAALVGLTPLLMDFVLSKGKVVKLSKAWIPCMVLLSLIVVFSRNNGIYIIACLTVVLAAYLLIAHKRSRTVANAGRVLASLCGVIVLFAVVTGPVYKTIGVVPSEKAESVGIMLNQIARVAALDGDMSENDRSYLASIVPYEQYKELYSPTCTDSLKWNASFNADALDDGFFSHWLSLFLQNPRVYFEAWELQTFGFWVVNEPHVYACMNTSGGVIRNTNDNYRSDLDDVYQINAESKLGHDSLRALFPEDSRSIPIGIVFWTLLFLATTLALQRHATWLVALIPSLALIATLIVASPIWYWPRYGAAVQLLIPFYVALAALLHKGVAGYAPDSIDTSSRLA